MKATISGAYKHIDNNYKPITYIFNGDIETDSNGDEVYIESTVNGEQSAKIKDMPLFLQEYIKANKLP